MSEYINKKWGYEKIIVNNDLYCLKDMFLFKGHYCSAHTHPKDESFFVREGKMLLITGPKEAFSKANGIGTWCTIMERGDWGGRTAELIPYKMSSLYDEVALPTVDIKLNMIEATVLRPEDMISIPRGLYHLFYGLEETKFTEVSTPDHGENTRLTESW